MKTKSEYDKFESLVSGLLKVPHCEIKAKLDAEKQARERKKAKRVSASRVAGDKD